MTTRDMLSHIKQWGKIPHATQVGRVPHGNCIFSLTTDWVYLASTDPLTLPCPSIRANGARDILREAAMAGAENPRLRTFVRRRDSAPPADPHDHLGPGVPSRVGAISAKSVQRQPDRRGARIWPLLHRGALHLPGTPRAGIFEERDGPGVAHEM